MFPAWLLGLSGCSGCGGFIGFCPAEIRLQAQPSVDYQPAGWMLQEGEGVYQYRTGGGHGRETQGGERHPRISLSELCVAKIKDANASLRQGGTTIRHSKELAGRGHQR
uniref:Uncharacterized protein n=1 Tax=Sphaerodactylus townsendi TaxID=933632 RepID=A0ACB8F0X6_9SAUR